MPRSLFNAAFRKMNTARSISIRSRVRRPARQPNPLEGIVPIVINGRALNRPETLIAQTLAQMKIQAIPQFSFLGGDFLGGGRMDWYLPRYRIDLEYNGPFHETSGGKARDALRNVGVRASKGVRVEALHFEDLFDLKAKIRKIVGWQP